MGEAAASRSGGMVELSKINEHHSERDGHRVVSKKYGLSLPIPLSNLPKTPGVRYPGEFKVVRLRDWAQYIVDMNCWHILVGLQKPNRMREQDILREFWARYRQIHPTHELWKVVEERGIDLSLLAPMLVHGDEGRGRKKAAFLVLAWHSMLGRGTVAANAARKSKPYLAFKLNYAGSTHGHRFITAVLPKIFKDEMAGRDIMSFVADDSLDMTLNGVKGPDGQTFRMVCLNVCGEWAWLVKAGHLTRSFHNVEKRPRGPQSNPRGICHLCRGGQLNIPWEDFRLNVMPMWRTTRFQDDPFTPGDPSPFCRLLHLPGEAPLLFAFDLWHCYHLGVGKTFLASCLALMSDLMLSGNIDGRFEELTQAYLAFCDRTHQSPVMSNLTKESLGWPDRSSFPNGQWSKGHITTLLGDFVEDWLSTANLSGSPLLQECFRANAAVGHCMRTLYASDIFLTAEVANDVASSALFFLSQYQKLATDSFNNGQALFAYMPKSHAFAEVFWDVRAAASQPGARWVLSPLTVAVQIDEDYIGKTSRLSRRVSPQQVIRRTLERSLQAAHKHWILNGYIRQ